MSAVVLLKNYEPPKFNVKEILRYAGVKEGDGGLTAILNECLLEVQNSLVYKVCYAEFSIKVLGDIVDFGFTKVNSKSLAKNLEGSNACIIFAATVGINVDRLISRYSAVSSVKALTFQAIGAERIESLCNLFNCDIKKGYNAVKPRFSPGYGDLDIEFQREIFSVLNCNKNIGVTLNESMLMSPSKSVTAIIGVTK